MGEMRNAYKILLKSLNRRDYSEHPSIDGKIILDWIMGK
jgi:hypothetical protein